ncbi:DUF7660 family protein [Oceaniferula spumae]
MNIDHTEHITSKDDLARFLDCILDDHAKNGGTWENNDLPSFIEALQAWLRDNGGYYRNMNIDYGSVNPWREISEAFSAARIYE